MRRLKGYQKSHHLPDGHHAAAQAFVRKVGHEHVKELVDQFYTDIRSLFGHKRREFALHLRRWLRLHQRRPTSTYKSASTRAPKIRRIINSPPQIVALHNPEIVGDERFHACFTHHCETLIVEFPGSINIDEKIDAIEDIDEIAQYLTYEPDGSAFDLRLIPLDLEIKVTESEMSFQLLTLRNLDKLIEHSQKAFEILTAVGLGASLS